MNLSRLAVLAALVLGAAATVIGLGKIQWAQSPAISWDAWQPYVVLAIASALLVEVLARWRSWGRAGAALSVGAIAVVVAGAGWPLLVVVAFGLASHVVGGAALRLLGAPGEPSPVIALLVGAGLYGTAVGLAAHFSFNTPPLYALAVLAPLVFGWRTAWTALLSGWRAAKASSPGPLFDLVIAVVAIAHVAIALMPEVGHDALATHLFVPAHLATRKSWGFDVGIYVWAVMPMMGDWIYSLVYMLAGEQASRLVNVGFVFANCLLIREIVRWIGGSTTAVRWAVLLFLTTPLTFLESSSLYIESVWAAFVVGGVFQLLKALDSSTDEEGNLPAAGLLLGAAMAAKAITLSVTPVLLLVFVLYGKRWANWRRAKHVAIGFACLVVVGVVPYLTAWVLTSNPLFPFFNGVFKSPLWPAQNFEDTRWTKGLHWNSLYRLTFQSNRYLEALPGAAGFHNLLLLLPAAIAMIALRNRRAMLLLAVAICEVALTFRSVAYLRYIFPSFIMIVAVIGVAIAPGAASIGAAWSTRWLAASACAAVALNLLFFKTATNYGELQWRALISPVDRALYLAPRLPIRNAVELINRVNQARSPVAVFSSPLAAGLVADAYYPTWYNIHFQGKISAARSPADIAAAMVGDGIEYLILDKTWGQGEQRAWIETASDLVSDLGQVSVRKIKSEYRVPAQSSRSARLPKQENPSRLLDAQALDSAIQQRTVQS